MKEEPGMSELQGRAALITGAAVRIGRAIAEALAREGVHVILHYHESAAEAREACDAIRAAGGAADALPADLARPRDAADLIRRARAAAGRLDILVNNAAVFHRHGFGAMTEERILGDLTVNLISPMLLTQALAESAEAMSAINLLDRRIAADDPSCIPYSLSKKALADFTRLAAAALAPRIAVNAVAPGAILPPPGASEQGFPERAGRALMDHRCTPEDVAAAVVFLLRHRALTGQTIYVDGGQHVLGNAV
jgi:pteridine reductase